MRQTQSTVPTGRLTSIVSIWQFTAVVLGYMFTRRVLRGCEAWNILDYYLSMDPILTRWTLLVRSGGCWFVGLPILWWVFAIWRHLGDARGSGQAMKYTGGIILAIVLTLAFAASAAQSLRIFFGPVVQ
jgi:hypothetical protein